MPERSAGFVIRYVQTAKTYNMCTGPALAGAGPNARLGAGPLWAVLYGVIVLSQPCYHLFDENILAKSLHEYQKRRQIYWSWSVCRLHDNPGVPNLGAFTCLNGYIQARNCGSQGAKPPWKIFRTPPENCVGHSVKTLGPSQKIFAPHIVPSWLGAWLHLRLVYKGKVYLYIYFSKYSKIQKFYEKFGGLVLFYSAFLPQQILGYILIYRNAEGIHGQRKVANSCDNTTVSFMGSGHSSYVSQLRSCLWLIACCCGGH